MFMFRPTFNSKKMYVQSLQVKIWFQNRRVKHKKEDGGVSTPGGPAQKCNCSKGSCSPNNKSSLPKAEPVDDVDDGEGEKSTTKQKKTIPKVYVQKENEDKTSTEQQESDDGEDDRLDSSVTASDSPSSPVHRTHDHHKQMFEETAEIRTHELNSRLKVQQFNERLSNQDYHSSTEDALMFSLRNQVMRNDIRSGQLMQGSDAAAADMYRSAQFHMLHGFQDNLISIKSELTANYDTNDILDLALNKYRNMNNFMSGNSPVPACTSSAVATHSAPTTPQPATPQETASIEDPSSTDNTHCTAPVSDETKLEGEHGRHIWSPINQQRKRLRCDEVAMDEGKRRKCNEPASNDELSDMDMRENECHGQDIRVD